MVSNEESLFATEPQEKHCEMLRCFPTKEEALKEPGRLGLSYESTRKFGAVQCKKCNHWHIVPKN